MPTGYTAELMEKGMPFDKFVLRCARAMGALVMMRDEPMDAPIPEAFEPSDYHSKHIAEAKARLEALLGMNNDEKIAEGLRLKAAAVHMHLGWLTKEREENGRLEAMEAQVMAWTPPTADHAPFKDFMLDQLRISKNNLDYVTNRIKEFEAKAPVHFYTEAVAEAERAIRWNTEELNKDIDRNAKRNAWLTQLRKSLAS